MFVLALLLIFCMYFGQLVGWLLNLSGRFSMNVGIWTFVTTFAVFCFCK